jgi:hypothetical protein
LNGVQAVNARLWTNRLWVFADCINLIRESNLYRYPTPEEKRVLGENPIDENGHALDALRYMVSAIDRVREINPAKTVYPLPQHAPETMSTPELERALHEKQMAELERQEQREYRWNNGWTTQTYC